MYKRQELCVIISDEGLSEGPRSLQRIIKNWGSSGLQLIDLSDDVSADDCKDLALAFYVLVTEVIGPVEADTIVTRVISEVMNIEASKQFDPRNLL